MSIKGLGVFSGCFASVVVCLCLSLCYCFRSHAIAIYIYISLSLSLSLCVVLPVSEQHYATNNDKRMLRVPSSWPKRRTLTASYPHPVLVKLAECVLQAWEASRSRLPPYKTQKHASFPGEECRNLETMIRVGSPSNVKVVPALL